MTLKPDFFNSLASEIRSKYFPEVKYYRDDKKCEKASYSIELFNNGCLTYSKLIDSLSKNCNDTKENISAIVDKFITF